MNRITSFLRSRKGHDISLIALIVLTGTASFGLGRLSALYENRPQVSIEYGVGTESGKKEGLNTSQIIKDGNNLAAVAAITDGGGVVASRNGSVYHLPWCSGANRIKEENKVWYDSPEAAEAAGLRPAANCSGLE